jgi:hypothetical protein
MEADLILVKIVEVLTPYREPALALVALIAIDVLTGVGSAIKLQRFALQKLADFYRTSVLPQLVGWLSISALTSIAASALVDAELAQVISGAQAWSMYSAIVLALLASIKANTDEIMRTAQVIEVEPKSGA